MSSSPDAACRFSSVIAPQRAGGRLQIGQAASDGDLLDLVPGFSQKAGIFQTFRRNLRRLATPTTSFPRAVYRSAVKNRFPLNRDPLKGSRR
jgi:hypothetical protein